MELLACSDGTIGNLLGSPTCSGSWTAVIVPDTFPNQEWSVIQSGEYFGVGLTVAGVLMISALVIRSILNFIKY
jgi:hypothetical protein